MLGKGFATVLLLALVACAGPASDNQIFACGAAIWFVAENRSEIRETAIKDYRRDGRIIVAIEYVEPEALGRVTHHKGICEFHDASDPWLIEAASVDGVEIENRTVESVRDLFTLTAVLCKLTADCRAPFTSP